MDTLRKFPENPLDFIRKRVKEHQIYWSYHVNMRLRERCIDRSEVIQSTENYEIIESYPDDKYLPSYLVWTRHEDGILHVLFAVDVEGGNVRVITAYRPDPIEWDDEYKRRKQT
jgi:hypothetical protein